MGLGSTAKKLQKVTDQAEKLYGRMNEMREQLQNLKGTVEETGDRVEDLDRKVERQGAVIEALAEEQGIDVDSLVAEELIDDAEGDGDAAAPTDDATAADASADGVTEGTGSGQAN